MTTTQDPATEASAGHHDWQPPSPGPLPRGTVILLPGRGEHGGVYERFGRRLASDAYVVHALDVTAVDDPGVIAKQITAVSAHAVTPVVLAGSDTGALQALTLAASGAVTVDGLLLVGLPAREADSGAQAGIGGDADAHTDADAAAELNLADDADWDEELAARTTCPAHRGRLTDDPRFTKGSLLTEPIPSHLDLSSPGLEFAAVRTPVLVLHGDADPVAPVGIARTVTARLPKAELAVTQDGRHDVLNDATHRTVAAQVVQWLERLRNGSQLAPIIVVEDVAREAPAALAPNPVPVPVAS